MVWRIVAGTRYDYRDPRMTEMARKVVAISRASPPMPNLTWFVPVLGRIFPSTDTYLNQGCQMAKFDPFLSLDCARVEGVGRNPRKGKEGIKFCSVA